MASNGPTKYVKPKAAEAHFGIDRRTLRKWADAGHIRFFQAGEGKQRLYDISSTGGAVAVAPSKKPVAKPNTTTALVVGTPASAATDRVDAVYARVSTRKQLDDLGRQLATLKSAHPNAVVFTDCASGINFKRKGLLSLLQLAFEGRLRRVHIAHKDRLCRFAYDLIVHVLAKHGAEVVVESQDVDPTFEQDLADDVLQIITVFGARLHGRRSGQGRKRKRAEQQTAEEEEGTPSSDPSASALEQGLGEASGGSSSSEGNGSEA